MQLLLVLETLASCVVRNGCKLNTYSEENWGLSSHMGDHEVQQS